MNGYDTVDQYDGYTISFTRLESTDPRLGRNIKHDSRSLDYQVEAVDDISTLNSIRHQSYIPVLDQGNLGSCTGNAATSNVGTGQFWAQGQTVLNPTDENVDEAVAVSIYSDATKLDDYQGSYPPNDTGSDGLSVAKVLKNRGLISGYKAATSLEAVVTALASQPVITGQVWLNDMFSPDADGRLHITGDVAGGHEFVLDELDVENQRIWMRNSWSPDWGVEGRAYFTYDDFKSLMAQRGDCTVFTLISDPAPTPTPPQPEPTPTPDPDPTPTPGILNEIIGELRDVIQKLSDYLKSL